MHDDGGYNKSYTSLERQRWLFFLHDSGRKQGNSASDFINCWKSCTLGLSTALH